MDIQASAVFSDETPPMYRHRLDRWWSDAPRALICGANPSYAGADKNDPTIHSIIRLAREWAGCGGFTMVNEESVISTDPGGVPTWRAGMARIDPEGLAAIREANLALLRKLSAGAFIRIVAWGDLVTHSKNSMDVLAALSLDGDHPLYCLGRTKSGNPKHPLARGKSRIPDGTQPLLWRHSKRLAA